ncbi:aminoglycoside phosphotransferase family protein [Algihabitans albus]|uniref:aminoglycoside phosphotransferase family protein n=1 Tax=Algihabitans albus TaxID=2164067 RepID=UPI000E5D5D46|nr:phosphotransferase [Algihabitans albus]
MTVGDRETRLLGFLAEHGWHLSDRAVLAADASFRRYDRLRRGVQTAVLMDAPPEKEKPAAFLRIARLLRTFELSAPAIIAADEAEGFALLEDFGDRTFTVALAEGADERQLYAKAVETLVALQRRWRPETAVELDRYGIEELLREVRLLTDWTWPALQGNALKPDIAAAYDDAWREAFARLEALTPTLALRDFHVDNLMVLPQRDGPAAVGLLDFQDALIGHPAYDLVSLLEDARRDIAPKTVEASLAAYFAALPELDGAAFRDGYAILGAQRAAKIVGVFTRLDRRDGKAGYLRHIPRTWRHLNRSLAHPALEPVNAWFAAHWPVDLRLSPAPQEAA